MVKTHVSELNIGILNLQGAFNLHEQALTSLGVRSTPVKKTMHLDGLDGIIIPGGESTVMAKLLDSSGIGAQLKKMIANGFPNFGTCAGLILQSQYFGNIECKIQRNAYGTQNESFEQDIVFEPTGVSSHVFFIRAPKVLSVGKDVKVLARVENDPVALQIGSSFGITFHPEVADNNIFHRFFVDEIIR